MSKHRTELVYLLVHSISPDQDSDLRPQTTARREKYELEAENLKLSMFTEVCSRITGGLPVACQFKGRLSEP